MLQAIEDFFNTGLRFANQTSNPGQLLDFKYGLQGNINDALLAVQQIKDKTKVLENTQQRDIAQQALEKANRKMVSIINTAQAIYQRLGDVSKKDFFDQVKAGFEDVGKTIKGGFEDFGSAVESFGKDAVDKVKAFGEEAANNVTMATDMMKKMIENWQKGKERPVYCDQPPTNFKQPNSFLPPLMSAYDNEVDLQIKKEDTEGYLELIKAHAPVVHLEDSELYLPIWPNEYFTSQGTSIKLRNPQANTIMTIAGGEVGTITFEKMYENFYKNLPIIQRNNPDMYIDNPHCTIFGSNPNGVGYTSKGPVANKDANGNLITPMWVVTSEQDNNIYIQYLYFYGLNGPYDIGPLQGNVAEFQNYHESDLEHVTLEFDKSSRKLKRIYYGSHGKREGFWLDANHPDIKRINGRILVYSAHYGHGCYPQDGTYVRIFGVANDVTGNGIQWIPQNLVRLYPEGDPRFNPKTMGFLYFAGRYGAHGIDSAAAGGWFPEMDTEQTARENRLVYKKKIGVKGDIGRAYTPSKWFCENPSSNFFQNAKYIGCIVKSIPEAGIPD
ncbi:MAG: Vps62-related protein [Candidatus Dependentiae bacterium]|nr:Vps62-related protein [Candidatus Dependentiae bacterium]